jgi:hypothetical protein
MGRKARYKGFAGDVDLIADIRRLVDHRLPISLRAIATVGG